MGAPEHLMTLILVLKAELLEETNLALYAINQTTLVSESNLHEFAGSYSTPFTFSKSGTRTEPKGRSL